MFLKKKNIMQQKVRLHLIDTNNPIDERIRSKRYRDNDEAILNLVRQFDVLVANSTVNAMLFCII
jgi:glycerol-3-phosphate cytidylyltransferase-like family protein